VGIFHSASNNYLQKIAMPDQIRVLNVNNLRNRFDSQGLSLDLILGYFFVVLAGLIGFALHRRFGVKLEYIILTTGTPATVAYILLFLYQIKYQYIYTLIIPAFKFLVFRNKRKLINQTYTNITDNIIETDKEYLSITQIFPQDIFLKNLDDRNSFNYQIKELLNNLRGVEIQIKVVCRVATKHDYLEYFTDISNQKNIASKSVSQEIDTHVSEVISLFEDNSFTTKDFYLIIKQRKVENTENDTNLLLQKTSRLSDNLAKVGIKSKPLTETQTKKFANTHLLFGQKDIAKEDNLIDYGWDYFKSGNTYKTIYSLTDLPTHIQQNQIYNLLNNGLEISFDYHIRDTEKKFVQGRARERIATIEDEQRTRVERGGLRSRMQDQELSEIQDFDEMMVQGVEKPFLISINSTLSSPTKQELNILNQEFIETSRDIGLGFSPLVFRQEQSLNTIVPICSPSKRNSHLLSTSVISYLLPFVSKKIHHKNGIFLGSNHFDQSPVFFNLFSEQNYNMNIMGASGGGKSVWTKSQINRTSFLGFKTIVLDPENEYVDMTTTLKGEVVEISKEQGINPFGITNISKETIEEQVETLKLFLSQFIYNQTYKVGAELGSILTKYYSDYTNKKINQENLNMEGFLDYCENTTKKNKVKPDFLEDLQSLRIGREYGGYFSNNEQLDISSNIVCFALKKINSSELILNSTIFLISKLISNKAIKKEHRILLYVDEAHLFLNNSISSKFLLSFAKTARKYRMGLVCISQNIQDWNEENGGAEILRLAQTNIILKQTTASITAMKKLNIFALSEEEEQLLKTTSQAGTGIIYRENEHIAIDYKVLPSEWRYVSTTHEEDKKLREVEYD
jgi:conjugal transfer ATP-binding protein TraC